ncbi:MAG: hypothetical protein IT462_03145 [Planctomycetes bacterium]|nr:hypothetical protein [Planctomycetota bacterium]
MAKYTAAGINLSAFGADRRPVLATASNEGEGVVRIDLSPLAAFGGKAKLMDPLEESFARWRMALVELPRPIAVDCALDLQDLAPTAKAAEPKYSWQLSHRAIDFAFYGDAPITDRIGVFGQRFRAMLGRSTFAVGQDLIEANPGACIEMLKFKGSYKGGAAHHARGGWKADNSTQANDRTLADVAQELGLNIENDPKGKLDSGDLDAILCTLTSLAVAMDRETVTGKRLGAAIGERVTRRMAVEEPEAAFKSAPQFAHVIGEPFWQAVLVYRAKGDGK